MNELSPIRFPRDGFDAPLASGDIAIIGMSGRFPGAPDVGALWTMVREGRDAFRLFSPEEIEDAFDAETRASPDYVPARPALDGVEFFDAGFFGMMPREAAVTDPQQRIFLEIAWEALEEAGYDPARTPGAVGVYAGASLSTYLLNNVLSTREKVEEFTSNYQVGCYQTFVGALADTLATRVAFKLDLRGPAVTLLTACSTSLLCVAEACRALRAGSCDMALAGGVSITFPQKRGYIHQAGGMVAPDGICRPLDEKAGGTVFGSGAGVVLLKRLEEALADGDHIHAVIKGCGVNNDGAGKVSYTGPSIDGQAEAIAAAHADAGVDPATIGYVECHGTATPLGDPIEFMGLSRAFRDVEARGACVLGSTKGNVGHLDAAAGVTGLIKTAMMLREREIPPLAQFTRPNPRMDLAESPFTVETRLRPWESAGPRRAGVSAFGIGGTNVHVVMEEPPRAARASVAETADRGFHVLPLSARDETALEEAREALRAHLEAWPDLALADVAFTLGQGRHAFAHRAAVVARSLSEAVETLGRPATIRGKAPAGAPPVAFLFPGQGAQYPGMASGLYAAEPGFRAWIDRGAEILEPLLGFDIRSLVCREGIAGEEAARALRDTQVTQPALFLVEYATARLFMDRGIRPAAMVGHSVGEFAAAAISGVLSFEDALRLIAHRGRLMRGEPGGAMLSVRAGVEAVRALRVPGIDIAAVNAPKLTVVAGPFEAIEAFERVLAEKGLPHGRLHTSHAFHSAMMDGVVGALRREAEGIAFGAAEIPYVSTVDATWVERRETTEPAYWAGHCRATVRFADALETLCADRTPLLLEIGPGRTLATFAAQTIGRDRLAGIVTSLPDHERALDDRAAIAEAEARLWVAGADIAGDEEAAGRRVPLPTYRFQRERHWLDAPKPGGARAAETTPFAPPAGAAPETPADPAQDLEETTAMNATPTFPNPAPDRKPKLETDLLAMLAEMSGEELDGSHRAATFLELGFDSLFLGQVAQEIGKRFGPRISFRQLLGDLPSVADLAAHLDAVLPPEAPAAAAPAPAAPVPAPVPAAASVPAPVTLAAPLPAAPAPAAQMPVAAAQPLPAASGTGLEGVLHGQLQALQAVFAQQMQLLQSVGGLPATGIAPAPAVAAPVAAPVPPPAPAAVAQAVAQPAERPAAPAPAASAVEAEEPSRFRMYKPGSAAPATDLAPETAAFVADLVRAYGERHPTSKAMTDAARPRLADPRTVAGFRPLWKDAVFPIVSDWSKGARIRDLDGNEFVDVVSGYGQNAFGHAPDFVVAAVEAQLHKGFAIGPQSPLAGTVARRIGDMIGHERVTFCNTGSEAVMAAMRVARCVTGRDLVVVFSNDYHGQFDEVLVKGRARTAPRPVALPLAPGIPAASVSNMMVLGYGAPESLDWIRAHGAEIAAVVIEPVQSRHPELRPVDFVRQLRAITAEAGTALVFDEVVSGFRAHPGGVQALWGIKGDMATYGKVLGGGMPLGILAGTARFMDALDGGAWAYGDASEPEVSPTFFAGTFVRHPLVLAAANAVLDHIESPDCRLYDWVAPRTAALVAEINADLERAGVPARAETFSSWFMINFGARDPLGSLIYTQLRQMGLHIQEGFPCYFTSAHGEADFAFVAETFRKAVAAVQGAGILRGEGTRPAAAQLGAGPAPVAEAPREAPLTEAQMEVWLAAQLGDEASCAFNESFSLTLEGRIDEAALLGALDDVTLRHDALRLRFDPRGASQTIDPAARIPVVSIDLSAEEEPETALAALLDQDARTSFDLSAAPPARVLLVRLAAERHVLVFTAHHIVCDGWSGNVVAEALASAYRARVEKRPADLAPAPSFLAHALGQGRSGAVDAKAESYWRGVFETIPDDPDMPLDRPRPELRSYAGATWTGRIDAETAKRIKQAGARQGCTLFSTLLAGLQVAIARLSGHDDIVVAVPSAGQSLHEEELLVGHCVNLLPIRAKVERGATVRAHLTAVQRLVLEAFEHQGTTYGTLVRKLGVKRAPNLLPLTQIQFNLERLPAGLDMPGLAASLAPNPKAFSNFDMFMNVIEGPDGLRIDVDYNADILDGATIERWVLAYRTLLEAMAADPETALADLAFVPAAEAGWLVETLNETQRDLPAGTSLLDLFAARVAETPEKVAATHQERVLTYAGLSARVDAFAGRLAARLPEPGARVAVAVGRGIDMLVALLGALKAGHAYVPLDPTHPASRLSAAMETGRIAALVCDDPALAALAPAGTAILYPGEADDAPPVTALPRLAGEAPAYIIFTSGSTGVPKGVEVPHRALLNFLLSMAREPGVSRDDTVVALTTVSFDIAGLELFLPLIVGGTVVIADRSEVTDGFALVERIAASKASVVQATPTLWLMLLEAGFKPGPGVKMLCGGEALPRDLADRLVSGGGELWNMYGPTETTIWSSVCRVGADGAPITIGHPIDNTALHILSPEGRLQPVGVVGELHIGGTGLANGYFGRQDLTDAAFRTLSLPGRAPERLYNTGDVGRRLADGSLQLLGRRDQQVKLRGFRIELGDIEAVLRAAPGVHAAAVAMKTKPNGDKHIVGYVVAAPGAVSALASAAEAAARDLPAHMVPTAWMALDALPQTGNGKLDRKALPEPAAGGEGVKRAVLEPRDAMERQLHEIWTEVLGLPGIGIRDNLFSLGADSLSMFRIAARMMDRGLGLEARDLLKHPTIEGLAAEAGRARPSVPAPRLVPDLKSFRRGARRQEVTLQ